MQTLVVTLIALGALGVVARRVIGAIRPRGKAGCPSCASGSDACGTPASAPAPTGSDVHPLVLVKSKLR